MLTDRIEGPRLAPLKILLVWLAGGLLGFAVVSNSLIAAASGLSAFLIGVSLVAADARPRTVLGCLFFLVLVADTKFRSRDPHALIAGNVDAQVLFELYLYALVLAVTVIVAQSRHFVRAGLARCELLFAGHVVLVTASTLWSEIPAVTMVRSLQLGIIFLLAAVSIRKLGPSDAVRTMFIAAVSYALSFSATAVIFPFSAQAYVTEMGRFAWLSQHPNAVGTFAGSAAMFVLCGCVFFDRGERPHQLARWGTLTALAAILAATVSRGAIVAFLLASTALLVREKRRMTALGAAVLTTIVLGLGGLGGLGEATRVLRIGEASQNPIVALLYRGQSAEEVASLTGRTELWRGMEPLLRERPILGHGFMSSRVLLADIAWEQGGYAHNAMMQSFLDLGLMGSLLLWLGVGSGLFPGPFDRRVCSLRLRRSRAIIFSAVLFLLLISITQPTFAGAPGHEALVLFVCVLAAERTRKGLV